MRATSHEPRATSHEPELCPKFSIIIPAYNCEKYIAKALDSLINQDIPERSYEIIITDDGSTDSTGTICDTYAAKYPFIHVTHTDNHGASHARNVALPQCRGEYITFCDADDFVSPHLVSMLSRILELQGQPDVVVWRFTTDEEIRWPSYEQPRRVSFSDGEELCTKMLTDIRIGGFTWNKLIKRDLISIGFDENMKVCMDLYWLLQLLIMHKNLRICITDYCLYCYVQVPNFGQSRDPARYCDSRGMNRYILSYEEQLKLPGLPPRAAKALRGAIYGGATQTLFMRPTAISPEVYAQLRGCMRQYAHDYYFSSRKLTGKLKTFIKHILVLLHIHKNRR